MKHKFLFALLVVVLGSGCDHQKKTNNKVAWYDAVEEFINTEHAENRFDGTIVIGTKDEVLFHKALGKSNRVWDIDMSDDTRFDIASVNKSFQAALILKASEEHLLALDNKLCSFFPELSFDSLITIHHLLTHTSGIPDYDAVNENLKANHFKALKRCSFTNDEYALFISTLEMVGQPGKQFHYSNFGYHLLALILEKVYQKPFTQILNDKICSPFGLNHTFSKTNNRIVDKKVAEGYTFVQDDSSYIRNNFIDLSIGRRIFSTSEDLYKWLNLLESGNFITPESYRLMTTNYLKDITKNISYGYGVVSFDGAGIYQMGDLGIDKTYIIHGGATEGYKAMVTNINHGEIIITFLANIGDRTHELDLTSSIAKLIFQ